MVFLQVARSGHSQRVVSTGEIAVTEGIYSEIRDRLPGVEAHIMSVRGKEEQIRVRATRL
jgi:hypothetical protein